MDVHDESDKYMGMLQNQKKQLERAKKRKGQIPRDHKPRGMAYIEFMMSHQSLKEESRHHTMHSSFIPPAYLPCTTPLAELKPVAIRQLKLETHHRGNYLLVRAITPPNRTTGILALVEDEHEDVICLQLYQQDDEEIRPGKEIVDVGTIFILKEPFFKIMASGDYGLRVDHLSDVVRLDKTDARLPAAWRPRIVEIYDSAESLKARGNKVIGEGKYWQAIEAYSAALQQTATPDLIDIIKRNRSLAFLKSKQFDAALSDTGFPDFGTNPSEKALFRAAEALYCLERFEECCTVLKLLCTNYPDSKQASIVLDRAQKRCVEKDTGTYDFALLQREAKKLRPPHLDHATYIGPVEIKESPHKGRGLFVTKAVKAGELLLCEKAFSHAYVPEDDDDKRAGYSKMSLLLNPDRNSAFMGGQADLMKLIVQKQYRNPSLAPAFTTLHHGSYKATEIFNIDGKPVVDTFLAERIMTLNVFGSPLTSVATHKDMMENNPKKEKENHSCGIWTQASYINHSCLKNAQRSFIGDIMIVRAAKDLAAGDEITFWYQIPTGDNPKPMKERFKTWGFACLCEMCRDEEGTKAATVAERKKLVAKVKAASEVSTPQAKKIEKLLSVLNNTYAQPPNVVPRLLLWPPQFMLVRLHAAQGNADKVLDAVINVLVLLGFVVTGADSTSKPFSVVTWGLVVDHLVGAFLYARDAFESLGAWADAQRAREYAKTVYTMLVGEDTTFEKMYKK